MTAELATPGTERDCTAVADDLARRLPGLELGTLRAIQHMLELRLGTGTAAPCDPERALVVALEIQHRHPAAHLQPDLDRLNGRSAAP